MFIVQKKEKKVYSLPTKELHPKVAKALSSELAQKILASLAKQPKYPIELAKELKVHEQKIYYHIRNLEKAGIIQISKKETIQGALTNYYSLASPSFSITFKQLEQTSSFTDAKNESSYLHPFIHKGQLDALIIVGSPDPHGPDKARSRDGYYGMDLALFLGTFLNYVPQFNVKLDTEVQESDLKKNLILIGGPIVNKVTGMVNAKLPVRFEKGSIYSSQTKESYPQDECGMVVKTKNPFDKDKGMLVVAGKRFAGTRASIISFLKHFDRIQKGNIHNPNIKANVVEGIDLDSDGIVDDVEFRE